MKEKKDKPEQKVVTNTDDNFPALQSYPVQDDIYNKSKQEEDIDPEDVSKLKEATLYDESGDYNENKIGDDRTGGDLDVPGSELDDDLENVGSEDEENNSYSLGGDNHNDLEENKGDQK
jgi:hypothetical protein